MTALLLPSDGTGRTPNAERPAHPHTYTHTNDSHSHTTYEGLAPPPGDPGDDQVRAHGLRAAVRADGGAARGRGAAVLARDGVDPRGDGRGGEQRDGI